MFNIYFLKGKHAGLETNFGSILDLPPALINLDSLSCYVPIRTRLTGSKYHKDYIDNAKDDLVYTNLHNTLSFQYMLW